MAEAEQNLQALQRRNEQLRTAIGKAMDWLTSVADAREVSALNVLEAARDAPLPAGGLPQGPTYEELRNAFMGLMEGLEPSGPDQFPGHSRAYLDIVALPRARPVRERIRRSEGT